MVFGVQMEHADVVEMGSNAADSAPERRVQSLCLRERTVAQRLGVESWTTVATRSNDSLEKLAVVLNATESARRVH